MVTPTTVVFLGPSLPLAEARSIRSDVEYRPPAAFGDVHRATAAGASVICLIDGVFDRVRSVWHKEILHALDAGVRVIGAASMGALRAAECAPFGMEPVGSVAWEYIEGRRTEDADVAVAHADASLGWRPLSVPVVDVDATVRAAVDAGAMSPTLGEAVATAAQRIYYPDRTWPAVLETLGDDGAALRGFLDEHGAVSQKAIDAAAALAASERPPERVTGPFGFAHTTAWSRAVAEIEASPL